MKKVKINNGITLIALVITIIILLVLAGITISQLSGSGIFERAKEARDKWQNSQNDEEMQIAKYSNEIDSYVDGGRNDTINCKYGTYTVTENDFNNGFDIDIGFEPQFFWGTNSSSEIVIQYEKNVRNRFWYYNSYFGHPYYEDDGIFYASGNKIHFAAEVVVNAGDTIKWIAKR